MCGIAGYFQFNPAKKCHPDLHGMTRLLAHRGPDDEAFFQDETVGLGMRRLAIIDLESGHQPMANEGGDLQVVFNGEIYNYKELRGTLMEKEHRFVTLSDTEVLVHGYEEWGDKLPSQLRGMFAFAIWDRMRRRLFLARDHFGIKPLYYTMVDGTFVFASEMKAILQFRGVSRDMDYTALDRYLSFLYIPEPQTIFKSIHALPAGHLIKVDETGLEMVKYWTFEPLLNGFNNPDAAVRQIREAVEDSVRAMLVSDVPVGVFLSGGLDSTSILTMMARHSLDSIKTFTIGFGADEKYWDEAEAAKQVASNFKTEHHAFRVSPDVVNTLPEIVRHFDQPFANPTAIILYLLAKETSRHVQVVLSGTGGDEMFAGYPRYQGMLAYNLYRHLPKVLRGSFSRLAKKISPDASDGRLWPQRFRRFFEGGVLNFSDCYIRFLTTVDSTTRRNLYKSSIGEEIEEVETVGFIRPFLEKENGVPEIERLMIADVNTYLPFNQLMYADRMSMAHGLEVRVPFVDQEMIRLAGALSLRRKLFGWRTKGLFRKAMEPFLPMDIINAPKKGLNLPIALWFRGHLKGWLTDLLSRSRLESRGCFSSEAVSVLLDAHFQGKRDNSLILWALAVLETWHQMYVD